MENSKKFKFKNRTVIKETLPFEESTKVIGVGSAF